MMKRMTAIFFALILVFSIALIPAGAAGTHSALLDDSADKLSPQEEATLTAKITQVSNNCECNVAFVIVNENDLANAEFTHNGTPEDYAKCYYNHTFGVNQDGVIVSLVISQTPGNNALSIYGTGKCEKRLSNKESEEIRSEAINNHRPSDATGYYAFFDSIADGLNKAIPPHLAWYMLPLALLIGFVIAMIVVLILRGQLKSVKMERGAVNYVRENSMQVTDSRDTYLYSTVSRTARPKNDSSSSSSSSGGSFSGGTSRF